VPAREPDQGDPAVADTSSDLSAAAVCGRGPRQVRAGDTLGRYDLGDELGEGGMATVFRARDRELRRDVAVKVLFPHLARRPEVVRRFHREARAAAGLEHPNILRIYDVGGGEGEDPPYIVMELIRGRTLLHEIEQRGAMLAEIAACIGALLGDALAAAHAAGVIHRDIKPANVLIAPGGRLLLADFGVARLETEDSLVTRTGALLGTPAYMSPEQASGDQAAASSDVYSLGATLYQLATGALPYSGSPAKVMSMIAAGNLVAPMRRRPSCGPDLSRLIERAMAAEPSARPASAIAVAAELRALAATGGLGDPNEELAAYFEDPDGFLRTRTPTVVTALVTAARTAIAEAKLPRAMALADRASALAPHDPGVTALIQTVTEGGRMSRRKRALALAGIAVALVGGATALGWHLVSPSAVASEIDARAGEPELIASAAPPTGSGDGPVASSDDRERAGRSPAASEASARDPAAASAGATVVPGEPGSIPGGGAEAGAGPRDAGAGSARDGRVAAGSSSTREPDGRRADDAAATRRPSTQAPSTPSATTSGAPSTVPPISPTGASPAVPPSNVALVIDAGVSPSSQIDAAVEPAAGHVIVQNPVWCYIWVDGKLRGNLRNTPLEVAAGQHVVRCVNPAGEWTQQTYVAPGATRTLVGTVPDITVRLAIGATIDGKAYARGSVVKLKPRRVEVIAGGKRQFITFRATCTLKDSPDLDCYQ
jgi:eukaryotic-like serine/threonine-protein kinase